MAEITSHGKRILRAVPKLGIGERQLIEKLGGLVIMQDTSKTSRCWIA